MDVHEFGEGNLRKLVLIPGNLMTWRQFEELILLLQDEFHVVAVSTDGYDGSGRTTFTTAQDSADRLAGYIWEKLDGGVDLVFGESMGCATAAVLFRDQKVLVKAMVLNGAQSMDLGLLNVLLEKSIPRGQYRMARGFRPRRDLGAPGRVGR